MKKIPVVKQCDLRDCGPCCILSILKYYNGFVPLEKIRNDSYTNNNGTTAYHIVNSLKNYGFDAYGLKLEIKDLKTDKIVLPLIAHLTLKNGLNHYIVIYKINKNHIVVMDPYKGIVKMNYEEFEEVFDNVVIFCYPQSSPLPKYSTFDMRNFIIQMIKTYKSLFLKILILGFLIVAFTIINSLYFKIGFNTIDDVSVLKNLIFVFSILVMCKASLEYLSNYFKNYLIKDIDYNLNSIFFNKLFNLPSSIVKNRTVGELVTRVSELNNLHEIISDIVVTIIINLFLASTTFIVLYSLSPILLKTLLIFTSVFLLICFLSNKTIYKMIRKNIESNENFNSEVLENCNAFDSVKNNNIENFIIDKIQIQLVNFLKSNFEITKNLSRINCLKNITIELMHFTIISAGFFLIIENKITLVNFITFESVLVYLIDPLKNIMDIIPKYNYLKASLEKIYDFLTLESESLEEIEEFLTGNIVVENVSYSYNEYENTLSDVNMIIKENSNVMIKGNSGSGKSTFCKLLNRTYEYRNGSIKINGINIKDYSLKTIRKNILYLSQNEFLFDDTIKNNIILDREFDVKKFNYICKICCVENFVKKRPLRYETVVNKDFVNLSGGEKQRIILARALYHDFKILILDEALSEVNINLEKTIIHNLKNFLSNKTLIYVTHKNHEKLFDNVLEIGESK